MPWCYNDNKASNGIKYGKLYNWYAVHDPRGLAPIGYHIPTDAEWRQLSDYLGGEGVAGTKMRIASGLNSDNETNSSGFSSLLGGFRKFNEEFYPNDIFGFWWSSSQDHTFNAWSRSLHESSGDLYSGCYGNRSGLSVRCLRD